MPAPDYEGGQLQVSAHRGVLFLDEATNLGHSTPAVPADERVRGRAFVSKLYLMTKGRDIHFDFRALSEGTYILDLTVSMSEQERRTIHNYYQSFFPEPDKRLTIADVVWKNEMIASADAAAEALTSSESLVLELSN